MIISILLIIVNIKFAKILYLSLFNIHYIIFIKKNKSDNPEI